MCRTSQNSGSSKRCAGQRAHLNSHGKMQKHHFSDFQWFTLSERIIRHTNSECRQIYTMVRQHTVNTKIPDQLMFSHSMTRWSCVLLNSEILRFYGWAHRRPVIVAYHCAANCVWGYVRFQTAHRLWPMKRSTFKYQFIWILNKVAQFWQITLKIFRITMYTNEYKIKLGKLILCWHILSSYEETSQFFPSLAIRQRLLLQLTSILTSSLCSLSKAENVMFSYDFQ